MFTVNKASQASLDKAFNSRINLFTPGQVCTIKGAKVVDTVFTDDNNKSLGERKSIQVVLDTSLGDLFFASLRRSLTDVDNKIHKPEGTFIDDFHAKLLALKPEDGQDIITNAAAAKQLTDAFKGKIVTVEWDEFARKDMKGTTFPGHVLKLNYTTK